MPGLYIHNGRTDGTVLSALIYNTDHQNHVNNLVPSLIDDYSVNVGQMQATADPGEAGSESLATTLAGELERLRFVIQEMRNTSQWYESVKLRTVDVPLKYYNNNGIEFPNDLTTQMSWSWYIPDSWAGGDLTLTFHRRDTAGSGVAIMFLSLARFRVGAVAVEIVPTAAFDYTSTGTTTQTTTVNVSVTGPPTLTTQDFITIALLRYGADGGDTLASTLFMDGLTLTYNAYAGRP